MVKNIDGRALAEAVKDQLAQEINDLKGPRPNLAIILVGQREDSALYVSLKEREGRKVGVDTHLYRLDEGTAEAELLSVIDFLNHDELIDGILVQLPLPAPLDADRIVSAIDPEKDVDGFHPRHPGYIVSPVIASVQACLGSINFNGQGRQAALLYHSEVFGSGLRLLLEEAGWNIVSQAESAKADLVITALGQPHFLKKEMVKDGAILIDIGISKVEGRIMGDVDYDDVKEKAGYITPVPGGIGPMTIAFLFKNVLAAYYHRRKL